MFALLLPVKQMPKMHHTDDAIISAPTIDPIQWVMILTDSDEQHGFALEEPKFIIGMQWATIGCKYLDLATQLSADTV
jgi:hypothetical protein